MLNKIMKNITYFICATLGHFNLILLSFPYFTKGGSGYVTMGLWQGGFSGAMISLIQVLLLLWSLSMLAYGIMGILKVFGVFNQFPEEIGDYSMKKIGEVLLYVYAGGNILLFIFMIIFATLYSVSISVGIFFTLILAIGAIIANSIISARFENVDLNAPTYYYACSKCGKKVKKGVNYCPDCGGKIEERQEVLTYYACSKCGKRAKKGVNFCSDCGGKIEEKIQSTDEPSEDK